MSTSVLKEDGVKLFYILSFPINKIIGKESGNSVI